MKEALLLNGLLTKEVLGGGLLTTIVTTVTHGGL